MKILLINKFHYMKGGSETYYFGLGDLLKQRGHEVIYFSMKDDRNVPCEQDKYFVDNIDYNAPMTKVQMVKAGIKTLYSLEAKKKLEQLIQAKKPDIAHLNIFQSQLTSSVVDVLYKHKIPMVYTMHDLKPICPTYLMMCQGQICKECMHGNYLPCIKKHCMKNSFAKSVLAAMEAEVYRVKKTYDRLNLIITPSDYHKKQLLESGITRTRIIRMRNFLPGNIKLAEKVEAGEYFLYFGRISQEKGIITLINAYKRSNVDVKLYVVGSGPLDQEIQQLVHELGLQNKVMILGFKRGEELQDIVRKAKCVFLPSECSENSPLAVLESMAAGRPIVVSRNGGLPELVSESENGFIVEPGNIEDIARIMKHMETLGEEELINMGICSQKMVLEMADRERYIQKIEKIYQKCIEIR